MSLVKLHLSGTERKAVFRASQLVYHGRDSTFSQFADDLCEKLDDGGVWNPCVLAVCSPSLTDQFYSGLCFAYVLSQGKHQLDGYKHTLEMVEHRLRPVDKQPSPSPTTDTPPFLRRDGYYGPDWSEVRVEAIERDRERCTRGGLSREEHRQQVGQDLHVHHVTPLREIGDYRRANELENLRTLCWRCHTAVE